jgi:hypothetical protein
MVSGLVTPGANFTLIGAITIPTLFIIGNRFKAKYLGLDCPIKIDCKITPAATFIMVTIN